MDDNTFTSFIETVRRESFDDSRMAIVKLGVDQNYFTSAQAKQLVSLFSFESSKLEIAKYIYGKTTDPKNYFIVYNAFSFSKTKEELAEYVRTYKP
jgi:ABC-type thiamine transport system substrate-binding protein